ncbi:MAG TPA: hypothetical protein VF700_08335 [Segetibacter sp.]
MNKVLLQLKEGLRERDIKRGQLHKIFEDSLMQSLYITGNFWYKK